MTDQEYEEVQKRVDTFIIWTVIVRDLDTYTEAQDYRDWRTEQGMANCYFKESLFKK